jgi:hypothetical protein
MFPKMGKTFPDTASRALPEQHYAEAIAAALTNELGESRRAIKTVMRWTGANERTVKNWFAGTSGPSGQHLIAVVRHSDAVFEAVMALAGRNEVAAAKRLVDARETLVAILEIIVDLTASDAPISGPG